MESSQSSLWCYVPLRLNPEQTQYVPSPEIFSGDFFIPSRSIDPVNVFPGDYNSVDPLAADYYRPRTWYILGRKVHASRLLRVVPNEAPLLYRPNYNFLGIPQAQILWDYVLHFQENRDAENRLLNKFSTLVFKTDMSDIFNGARNLEQLDLRMQILARNRSNDGVLAIDRESEDVIKIETPLSGVSDIVRQSLEIVAALNRTPAVKLLGISPSGFNATGESDIRNYYDHIASQQEKILRPVIQSLLDVLEVHLWGETDPDIHFEFAPLSETDDVTRATSMQTRVNTLTALLDRDVLSPEEVRRVLIEDPDSGLNDLDPEDVPEPSDIGQEETEGAPLPDVEANPTQDEEQWITTGNGKHVEVEEGTGKILKGNIGQWEQAEEKIKKTEKKSEPLKDTKPDMELYKQLLESSNGSPLDAAKKYFNQKLQAKSIKAETVYGKVDVHFTSETFHELRENLNKDPVKAELVPYLPDIISTGTYRKNELHKERKDKTIAFHAYSKQIKTSAGIREAIVDVAERPGKRFLAYHLTHEGQRNYAVRKANEAKKDGIDSAVSGFLTGDALPLSGTPGPKMRENAALDEELPPFFEVVNIRFAGER